MRLSISHFDRPPQFALEDRDWSPLLGLRRAVQIFVRVCLASLLFLLVPAKDVLSQPTHGSEATEEHLHSARDTVSTQEAEQLIDLLEASLGSLAEEDRRGRRVGGCVLLGLGAGSAAGGFATIAAGEGDDARIVGYSLIGGGALFGGLSVIPFNIRTEPERMYAEFQEMPAEGSDQGRLHTFVWPALGGVTRLLVKTEEEQRYETYCRAREDILQERSEAAVDVGVGQIPTGDFLGFVRVRF